MTKKYVFVDMDGTLASFENDKGKINLKLDEFTPNFFINRRPLQSNIKAIYDMFKTDYIFILSAVPTINYDIFVSEKCAWLDKHFNIPVHMRNFVKWPDNNKAEWLREFYMANNIDPHNIVLIDDEISTLKEAEAYGIKVYHPTYFQANGEEMN